MRKTCRISGKSAGFLFYYKKIKKIDRANAIISEFLSLAKNKAVDLKRDNLNHVISTLLPLLQAAAYLAGHDIQVEMGDIPDNDMNEKELRQLVLNMARNGIEAMRPCGTLTIKPYGEKKLVVSAVSDTGNGMPQEVLGKPGTPFVTTKENRTGLGMPVCYQIAKRHAAKIDVKTSPQGTTFFVRFKI